MNKLLLIIIYLFAVCNSAYATSSIEILKGLFDSKVNPSREDVPEIQVTPPASSPETMTRSIECKEKDQSSLPLRYFLGLLRNKGAVLTPSHDVETGTLKIYGGPMIGNCSSMLSYIISPPSKDLPYVFEVKIKGCGNEVCDYPAKKINEKGETEDITVKVEPSMSGFFKCLENTGVLKDGKVNQDKIVVSEMKVTKTGIQQSGQLWFASHGQEGKRVGGVFSTGGNKLPRDDCYYFEDIQQDGFQIYSQAQREQMRQSEVFEQLCKVDNYKLIDRRIGEFDQVKSMQAVLKEVRNDLLKEEAKKLAEQIKESTNFTGLDAAKIREVFEDFNKYIIQDLKDELFGVYENGVLKTSGLYDQILREGNKDKKAKLITQFMKKLDELNSYSKPPYPSASTAKLMESFKRQAPLDDENWYQAVVQLNETLNTVIGYSLPYKKMLTRYSSRKDHKFTKFPTINFSSTKRSISDSQRKLQRELSVKSRLVANGDYSRSRELKREASDVRRTSQDNLRVLQQEMAAIEEDMQSQCCYIRRARQFDPACVQSKYYRNVQRCAMELEEDLQQCIKRIERLNQDNDRIAASLDQEARSWEGTEKERDRYYESGDEDDDSDRASSPRARRAVAYDRQRSAEQIRSSFAPPQGQFPPQQQGLSAPYGLRPPYAPNPMMQTPPMSQFQFSPQLYQPNPYMMYQMHPPFMAPMGMPFGRRF